MCVCCRLPAGPRQADFFGRPRKAQQPDPNSTPPRQNTKKINDLRWRQMRKMWGHLLPPFLLLRLFGVFHGQPRKLVGVCAQKTTGSMRPQPQPHTRAQQPAREATAAKSTRGACAQPEAPFTLESVCPEPWGGLPGEGVKAPPGQAAKRWAAGGLRDQKVPHPEARHAPTPPHRPHACAKLCAPHVRQRV